jgi:hypothetical protein
MCTSKSIRELFKWNLLAGLLVNTDGRKWSRDCVHDTPAVKHEVYNRSMLENVRFALLMGTTFNALLRIIPEWASSEQPPSHVCAGTQYYSHFIRLTSARLMTWESSCAGRLVHKRIYYTSVTINRQQICFHQGKLFTVKYSHELVLSSFDVSH